MRLLVAALYEDLTLKKWFIIFPAIKQDSVMSALFRPAGEIFTLGNFWGLLIICSETFVCKHPHTRSLLDDTEQWTIPFQFKGRILCEVIIQLIRSHLVYYNCWDQRSHYTVDCAENLWNKQICEGYIKRYQRSSGTAIYWYKATIKSLLHSPWSSANNCY